MSDIQISKDVPIPETRGLTSTKYPFRLMEIGDSFLYPKGSAASVAHSASYQASRRLKKKFITRREGDQYRCWRIE